MREALARQNEQDHLSGLPERISHVVDRAAKAHPDRPALIEGDTVLTYADLAATVSKTAAALADLGIRPGDRVMIVSENSLALAAILLGASELDAWAIVVNPRLSAREIDQIRDHAGARRVFYTAGIGNNAAAHAERHGARIESFAGLDRIAVGPLNEAVEPEPVEASGARQVAVLLYTSGTTGNPKGVMLTHRNLLFNASVAGALRDLVPADRIYGVLPMSHIVGLSVLLLATLFYGASVQIVPQYDPADLAAAIAADATVLFGVPATYQRLLEYKTVSGLEKLERGKLRYMGVAGAPLDLTLKGRIEQELGLPLLNAYGTTECAPGVSGVLSSAPREDDSVGTLIPGIEARIVGRDGKIASDGEVGELHIRGPNVMRGYYRAPEATAAVIDGEGWFNTGDLARFEGENLYIVGRTKELIIRSGFNVYPAEVEAVLNAHEAVVQSAVVGRSAEGNEEVVAYVQLLPGSTVSAADLASFAAPQLTAYKRPSEIVILEALPASSTGKILKHRLAEAARNA